MPNSSRCELEEHDQVERELEEHDQVELGELDVIRVGLRPPIHRGAVVSFDVPSGAGVASGCVYRPPQAGAVISYASMTAEAEAPSQWRWNIVSDAFFAGAVGGVIGIREITPLWGPNYQISGRIEQGQWILLGDGIKVASGTQMATEQLVMPGNVFWMFLTLGTLGAEGGFVVHEFTAPDEFERWNVGNVE